MSIYNKEYFLNECEGFEVFKASGGFILSKRLKRMYDIVITHNPRRVLDFGCGRGEFALSLAANNIETWACDISDDAVSIANDLKNRWERKRGKVNLNIIKIDRYLPFEDRYFDVCVMNDVIEHIDKNECDLIFKECKRILKNNGMIFIHTSPGRLFLDYGLLIYKICGYFTGYNLNVNLKSKLPKGLQKPYHLNEWSVSDIKKKLIKAGFINIKSTLWKNPHYAYYFTSSDKFLNFVRMVSKIIPFKEIMYADIFVSAQV